MAEMVNMSAHTGIFYLRLVWFRNLDFCLSRRSGFLLDGCAVAGTWRTLSMAHLSLLNYIFLIGIVGGWVQLDPLGTTATNRPIVPTPGDYEDGEIGEMMNGRGN
jgi:hypothetical protein